MKVLLRGGLAIKDHHRVRDGVFMGTLLRADSEPKRDYLCLQATIPVEQAKSLHFAIKENPNLELDVSALVLSFSYEVDDTLREWYHPRDLLVRESTPAAINWVSMPSDHEEVENEEAQEVAELDDDTGKSESYALPPEMQAQVAGVQLLSTISKDIALMATTVKRISLALWLGLAVIVLVIVF